MSNVLTNQESIAQSGLNVGITGRLWFPVVTAESRMKTETLNADFCVIPKIITLWYLVYYIYSGVNCNTSSIRLLIRESDPFHDELWKWAILPRPQFLNLQRAHDARIRSLLRKNDVATSFWRINDDIIVWWFKYNYIYCFGTNRFVPV